MAAGSGIEAVDLEGIQTSGGNHLSTLESHRATFTRLQALTAEAVTGWTGEAGTNFANAMAAWLQNYQVVGKVLDQMQERIVANRTALASTHDATAQAVMRVGAVMGEPAGVTGF
ncbi:WXG100 family type VII secretion target [Streptomyces sp. NPDC001770]